MTFTVYGTPAPQGSKSFKGFSKKGHAILAESSKNVKPWREAVKYAALEHREQFIGPVSVCITFTLTKPKSAPKKYQTFPDRKPDIDKLVRSTFDALSDAGVFEDDARVVELTASKVYPNEGNMSLAMPGAVITVEPIK